MDRFRGNALGDLTCIGCGRRLGQAVVDRDGERMILQLIGPGGARVEALQARIECPKCRAVRAFYASPVVSNAA